MNISIGSDHAGFEYRMKLIQLLKEKGHQVIDYGCPSEASVDFPDFAHPVGKDVNNKNVDIGILICGSGNGVAMTANKYKNVRAALCWNTDLAELARQHNDANIIVIPARFVSYNMAKRMLNAFLTTKFEGGRHQKRVDKINNI